MNSNVTFAGFGTICYVLGHCQGADTINEFREIGRRTVGNEVGFLANHVDFVFNEIWTKNSSLGGDWLEKAKHKNVCDEAKIGVRTSSIGSRRCIANHRDLREDDFNFRKTITSNLTSQYLIIKERSQGHGSLLTKKCLQF